MKIIIEFDNEEPYCKVAGAIDSMGFTHKNPMILTRCSTKTKAAVRNALISVLKKIL